MDDLEEGCLPQIEGWDDPSDVLSDYLDEWNTTQTKPSRHPYLRRVPISQWREIIDLMKMADWFKRDAIARKGLEYANR